MTASSRPSTERRSAARRRCSACLEGVYETRLETDAHAGPGSLTRVGVDETEQDVAWHVEACSRCGHVQIFRRDWRSDQHA